MKKLTINLSFKTDNVKNIETVKSRLYDGNKDLSEIFPDITFQWVGQAGIDDYADRKHLKVIDGYSIKLGSQVLYNIFVLEDGTYRHEHLFNDLMELAGNTAQNLIFAKGQIMQLQGYSHTVKNFAETYKNFYGPLTDEQKAWMNDNLQTFEQALADTKKRVAAAAAEGKGEIKGE